MTVFCQLAKPDPMNPTYIVGAESRVLARQYRFGSCPELHTQITTYNENRMVFNVTPKYSFVDLHIGESISCWAAEANCSA
jgi:hypothetical protein